MNKVFNCALASPDAVIRNVATKNPPSYISSVIGFEVSCGIEEAGEEINGQIVQFWESNVPSEVTMEIDRALRQPLNWSLRENNNLVFALSFYSEYFLGNPSPFLADWSHALHEWDENLNDKQTRRILRSHLVSYMACTRDASGHVKVMWAMYLGNLRSLSLGTMYMGY